MQLEEIDKLNLQVLALQAQLIINAIGQKNYNDLVRLKIKEVEYQKKVCEKLKLDITKVNFNYDTGEITEQKLEVKDAEHI